MESFAILGILWQLTSIAIPIFQIIVGVYANNHFKNQAGRTTLIGAIICLIVAIIGAFLQVFVLQYMEFDAYEDYMWLMYLQYPLSLIGQGLFLWGIYSLFRQFSQGRNYDLSKMSDILDV